MFWSNDAHTGPVLSVSCSPFTSHTASGSGDKTIRIWDNDTGAQVAVLEGHHGAVTCVAYNAKGMALASCSTDKTFKVWLVRLGLRWEFLLTSSFWLLNVAEVN